MTFGSLFSGIGGLDLGLERSGMTCKFQVEIDPFCRRVLAKHWPDVPKHDDVKTFPPTKPEDYSVDLICGGFPCQNLSFAGKGAGLEGERSGLWYEYARVIREIRPRFVLVENVAALLNGSDEVEQPNDACVCRRPYRRRLVCPACGRSMGDEPTQFVRRPWMGTVLGTLASLGYDAEWLCLPAAAVGAPHIRDRVFLVADRNNEGKPILSVDGEKWDWVQVGHSREKWLLQEPEMGRVAHGVPAGIHRLRGLGNAVVPQLAELIGRRILNASLSHLTQG